MADANSIQRGARFKDIAGEVFGTLTVVACVGKNKDGRILWRCVCECGSEKVATGKDLRRGATSRCKQCKSRKHGMSNSVEYKTWMSMLHRCTNSNYEQWSLYGGRGIKVCERWQYFEAFFEDMGKRPSKYHSIDRINSDGNYEPSNCRWGTLRQQNRNKRTNVMLTYKGETLCIQDWAARIGISSGGIQRRIRSGWSIDKIIETPVLQREPMQSHAEITHNGETMSLRDWSTRLNINYYTLLGRMRLGWSTDRMLTETLHS